VHLTAEERAHGNLSDARMEELQRVFLGRFDEHGWEDHDHADSWLTGEFAEALGLDVYATPFDPERGWALVENDRFRVVILRLESLAEAAPAAFRALLGLQRVVLKDRNISSLSPYGGAYVDFKSRVALPEGYVDRLYENRYARHFYSEDELATFRSRCVGSDGD
jgi:putative capsular polysaccharide synthesis protein